MIVFLHSQHEIGVSMKHGKIKKAIPSGTALNVFTTE